MRMYVTHVYNAGNQLHDFYVHQTPGGAVRQAAIDVVRGRFDEAVPNFLGTEIQRVIDAVIVEPESGRRYVRCDAWMARIDEMQVLL